MSIVHQIGLRGILPPEAPCDNCNAVEDFGAAIQLFYESDTFMVRELFAANTQVREGTPTAPFSYAWRGLETAGIEQTPPDGLLDLAPKLLRDSGSLPYSFDMPGVSVDILVPNIARASDSPRMDLLETTYELDEANYFLGRVVNVGSLNAMIDALEDDRRETTDDERREMLGELLAPMRIAQQYSLFFTFCI